jgi:hypothetical protein
MSTKKQQIISIARGYLRDFPQFFQTDFEPAGRTYEISSPNIDPSSLWVAYVPNSAAASTPVITIPSTDYDVDSRNGLIRLKAPLIDANRLLIEGYHYEWLSEEDLSFYADMAIDLDTHNLNIPLENLKPAIIDLIGVHTIIEALWGLVSEFSRDIDVITSESVHIPASQRFRMVQSLLDYWMGEYTKRATAMNIGIDRIEVFTLRRRSRTTERLVPIYREREIGDYGPMERLFPEIGSGVLEHEDTGDDLREEVYVDGPPPVSYINNSYY